MRAGWFRPPTAAVAAGLPALLAGLLVAPSPAVLVGPSDDTVRTVLADPPTAGTETEPALDGAHPVTEPQPQPGPALATTSSDDDSRGVPVRVSGTAMPARVLLAYRDAAADRTKHDPACHLTWSLVAGIGKVESGHAFGGRVDRQGHTLTPILGPVLDGAGDYAAITDTDDGRWDGDPTWDRAVDPMQFIPSSWEAWGPDADGDGAADPSDIDDAALAAGSYLCAGDRDLEDEKDRRSAVFSYNHSWDYVDLVLAWADAYATGTSVTGTLAGAGTRAEGGDEGREDDGTAVALGPPPTGGPFGGPTPAQPPASAAPTVEPAPAPSTPAPGPTDDPTDDPTTGPTTAATPTPEPTVAEPPPGCPTPEPTGTPTADPTATPSPTPTSTPTQSPTPDPTGSPTSAPTDPPAGCPTPTPTESSAAPAP